MGNRRLGRKRLESVLKKLNATEPDTAGSRSGLRAFEMPAWQLQPGKYWGLFDDFKAVSGVTDLVQDDDFVLAHASSGLVGAVWDVTAGGSSPGVTLDNAEVGGAVKLVAGTADDDVARLFAVNNPMVLDASNARKIWMEARLKLSDVDASGFFFGLAGNGTNATVDTSILSGGLADGLGWQIIDGQAAVTFASISAVGDSETVTQSSTSAADGTYVILSIYFDGTTAHFYINGKLSHSSGATLPTDGTLICPHIEFIQQTGDSDTLHVDYVNYCMER